MQVLQIKNDATPSANENPTTENTSELTWKDVQGLSWIFQDDL